MGNKTMVTVETETEIEIVDAMKEEGKIIIPSKTTKTTIMVIKRNTKISRAKVTDIMKKNIQRSNDRINSTSLMKTKKIEGKMINTSRTRMITDQR